MSAVLLLRACGPLQAYGTFSIHNRRATDREPSKSAVVGMLAAAEGRDRTADISDLASLRMAVRVDHEGTMLRDYHIALGTVRVDGKPNEDAVVTERFYLQNADFLIALAGKRAVLERAYKAIESPVYDIFLGRRCCSPSLPVRVPDGLLEGSDPVEALADYPWPRGVKRDLRVVYEDSESFEQRWDVPVSFASRRFLPRRVSTRYLSRKGSHHEALSHHV